MKKTHGRKGHIIVTIMILLVLGIIIGLYSGVIGKMLYSEQYLSTASVLNAYSYSEPAEKTIVNGDDIRMTIDYGYDGYAKYGRYMNVRATITGKEKEFRGWLQVIVPKAEKNVRYRKEVYITPGTTEIIDLAIPVIDDTGLIQVELRNDKDATVVEHLSRIKVGNYDKQAYIGVLTDDREGLAYLDTLASKVFYLDESKMMNDYLGLDLLDVIVINNFDTSRLDNKKLEALEKWVMNGGSLVVGTGEHVDKTLAKLGDLLGIKSTGTFQRDNITFGMNKKTLEELKQDILDYEQSRKILQENIKNRNDMLKSYGSPLIELNPEFSDNWAKEINKKLQIVSLNKTIAEVELKGSSTIVVENKKHLMDIRSLGHGNIQLFSFDMGIEPEANSFGIAVLVKIAKNLTQTKQNQLEQEYYGSYVNYGIYNSMSYTDTENIPKTGRYIFIIVIYILIVGPITFFVLKKLDKRSLTWIAVPILAIVFTFVVYIFGGDTRISEPYLGYVELLNYREDDTVNEEVYFALTAPSNHKYQIELDNKYQISELRNSTQNYYMFNLQPENEFYLNKYITSIDYGLDNTILEVNDNPAFAPVYFYSENTFAMENKLNTDIHYVGDVIYGKLTNDFDFDITNSMLVSDGFVISLGTLTPGETINITDKEYVYYLSREELYGNDNIVNRIAGSNGKPEDNTAEVNRKSNLLYYLTENTEIAGQNNSFLIGFIQEHKNTSFMNFNHGNLLNDLIGKMDSYGIKVVIIPVAVNYSKDAKVFVPTIKNYTVSAKGYLDKYSNMNYLISDNTTIEYQFPDDDTIISFEYLSSRNKNIEMDYLDNYSGTISFLNINTGDYDEVLKFGVGSRVTNVSDYLTEQNTLTIRYNADLSLKGYQMLLPDISYWKEAN